MEKQFERIYPLGREYTENPGRMKKQKFIEEEQFRRQSGLKNRPSNIKVFENWLINSGAIPKKGFRVGYFCNMIPQEIIRAFGAEAVRLDCGNSAAALTGEEMFSGDICPLSRASLGNFLVRDSLADTCDCLVLPASCDAKRKMGEILSDFKPVFVLNLPPEQNYEKYARGMVQELNRLVAFLEKQAGEKLKSGRLKEEIGRSNHRTVLVRSFHDCRIENPRSILPADLFTIIQASLFTPVPMEEWQNETELALKEVKEMREERRNLRPRLVLTGAPMVWPNFKILNILEECGADIVADTLCTGVQSLFDPVTADEKSREALLLALANRSISGSICPCFISQTRRINRVLDLVDAAEAQGVIQYSLRLCQLFDMENYRLEKILKQKKIPMLNVRSDYSLEDTEQIRVRVEAFLEI